MWVALQWKKTCVGREVSTSTSLQQHRSNEKDASTRDAADFLYNVAFLNFSSFLETSKSYQISQNENSILQEHPKTLNTKKCFFRWFKSSNIPNNAFFERGHKLAAPAMQNSICLHRVYESPSPSMVPAMKPVLERNKT